MPDAMQTVLALAPSDYSVWQEHLCDQLLDIDPLNRGTADFRLNVEIAQGGGCSIFDTRNIGDVLACTRSRRRVAREARAHAKGMWLVMQGTCTVERADGKEFVLRPGDLAILHSSEVWEKAMSPDYREIFVFMPDAYVASVVGGTIDPAAPLVAAKSGLGALLAESVESLNRYRRVLPEDEVKLVVDNSLRLVAAVFGGAAEQESGRPVAREVLRRRVLDWLEAHLSEPQLTPAIVAAHFGFSVRYLHGLFDGTGSSFGATLLGLRLRESRGLLADVNQRDKTVREIAFSCGFNDAAHFSRAFRAQFGMTPRDARAC